MKKTALFLRGSYYNMKKDKLTSKLNKESDVMARRLNLAESEYYFVRKVHHMLDYRSTIQPIREELDLLEKDDVLAILALTDIHPKAPHALAEIEKLHQRGVHIYICCFSEAREYASYRKELRLIMDTANELHIKRRTSTYGDELMNFAVSLRTQSPQVIYEDIEKHTGIPRSTLAMQLKYRFGSMPKYSGRRNIAQSEIDKINDIKQRNNIE